MTAPDGAAARHEAGRLPAWRFLAAMLALLLALKLALFAFAPPLADEAYYWMWGQHLALSYHDHPPLLAWLQRAMYEIFGWNLFALRALSVLTFLASAAILAFWARRLAPGADGRDAAAAALLVALASPVFFLFQTVAYPDHLLVALVLAAAHCFALFVGNLERPAPRHGLLYLAAAFIGLAGLAKYNAVFAGLGFAAWFLLSPRGRRLLASPHPWLAGLLAAAMLSPLLVWNIQNGFVSFRFHLSGRLDAGFDAGRFLGNLASFLALSVLFVSPFLLAPLWRFVRGRVDGAAKPFAAFGAPALILSFALFTALTLRTQVYYYWNIAALALFLPAAIACFRSVRGLKAHAFYGALAAAVVTFNYAALPVTAPFGGRGADERFFGWPEIAQAVREEQAEAGAGLLLTTHFSLAALLGFELARTDVYAISSRQDQYDRWFDRSAHQGATAIIVEEDYDHPIEDELATMFEEVTPLRTVRIERLGFALRTYRIHLGRNLR